MAVGHEQREGSAWKGDDIVIPIDGTDLHNRASRAASGAACGHGRYGCRRRHRRSPIIDQGPANFHDGDVEDHLAFGLVRLGNKLFRQDQLIRRTSDGDRAARRIHLNSVELEHAF